ncbi:hypothetical protein BdWA1_002636 [Babesia duncani]|uniref:Uncharacterized protein n=1 Tax=Babesia duncani TaxID=323732 RepID=A0AAD9PJL1_9APIC|nr:hypothetical protein BdWA1_002636 [Babesia duncani]
MDAGVIVKRQKGKFKSNKESKESVTDSDKNSKFNVKIRDTKSPSVAELDTDYIADFGSEAYFDSDEDEGDINRSGNVPLKWYEHEDHIGTSRQYLVLHRYYRIHC